MPADFNCGTASGEGCSIQSTWPDSKADVREFASGNGSSTTRSVFGTRFLSQYSLWATNSTRCRWTYLSTLNGPVPEGCSLTFAQSLPSFSHCAGLAIGIYTTWYGMKASGAGVVISIVYSSTFFTVFTDGMRKPIRPTWRGSN